MIALMAAFSQVFCVCWAECARYNTPMQDDQFDKLFSYLQKLDKRLEYVEENMATKQNIEHLINTMDDFIK